MCQRQDRWVDQLPHPSLSNFFTSTKTQVRNLYKEETDVACHENRRDEERTELKEAL